MHFFILVSIVNLAITRPYLFLSLQRMITLAPLLHMSLAVS